MNLVKVFETLEYQFIESCRSETLLPFEFAEACEQTSDSLHRAGFLEKADRLDKISDIVRFKNLLAEIS